MSDSSALKCLHCDSDRLVTGNLKSSGTGWGAFLPDEIAPAWVTMEHPAIFLNDTPRSVLCVDCGLVWLSTDTKEAVRKLGKYETDELKSRLGLDEEAES